MTKEYYNKHKHEWRKGGRYYHYIPKDNRPSKTKFKVKTGLFIISFD